MSARLTIVVLNYNYESFLPFAIDSALAQTYLDVEVVVVDDGSTDGSASIIDRYGQSVVAVRKPNGGQGSAMNAALEVATGEVLMFLDADDTLDPEAGSLVMERFSSTPATAWVMFRLRLIDGEGRDLGHVRPRRPGVMPSGDLRRHIARYGCFHWQPTSGNAFAVSVLRRVMPIPEDEFRISADAYLAAVVPLCGPVDSIDDVAGSYRLHGAGNYSGVEVDASYFRGQIERQLRSHRYAVEVGERVGVTLPEDPRAVRDAAAIGFRLASLLLDPAGHPFADERRTSLAVRGVVAALANPQLPMRNRLRRAVWFAACGATPRGLARRAAHAAPDTPARRQRLTR